MIEMGLGLIGGSKIIHKRKFRWTFRIDDICNGRSVEEHYVKIASRPNLTIEETEINFLNGKTWIPGKATWETITVTYYDIAGTANMALWDWVASTYDFTDSVQMKMSSARQDYSATGTLIMYDGCGEPLETWTLQDLWPKAINFGDLDYSSSDTSDIELTLRYGQVSYVNNCGGTITPCCQTMC